MTYLPFSFGNSLSLRQFASSDTLARCRNDFRIVGFTNKQFGVATWDESVPLWSRQVAGEVEFDSISAHELCGQSRNQVSLKIQYIDAGLSYETNARRHYMLADGELVLVVPALNGLDCGRNGYGQRIGGGSAGTGRYELEHLGIGDDHINPGSGTCYRLSVDCGARHVARNCQESVVVPPTGTIMALAVIFTDGGPVMWIFWAEL